MLENKQSINLNEEEIKVLIVDDKAENIFSLKQTLKNQAIKVVQCFSGKEALKLTLDHDFALILLDVQMPEMNGFEVAKLLKCHNKTKEVPIIFLTAVYKDEEYVVQGYDVGASDYLTKPINPNILIRKVESFLTLKQKDIALKKAIEDKSRAETAVKKYVTNLKQFKEQQNYQATHDPLTGLPNRILLFDRIAEASKHAKRNDEQFALLFIDLDNFKPVNDQLGHEYGDELLFEFAERLRKTLRESDTIARYGGDEFVILLSSIHQFESCEKLYAKIIDILCVPFCIREHVSKLSASIGIAIYPDDGTNAEELIKHADIAMYSAKQKQKGSIAYYDNSMQNTVEKNSLLAKQLKKALIRKEMLFFVQPVVDFKTKQILSGEVLIRWNHPQKGIMLPDSFLSVAEQSNIIKKIDLMTVEKTFYLLSKFHQNRIRIPLTVNISTTTLLSQELVKDLRNYVLEYQLPPYQLTLDLSCDIFNHDLQELEETINAIKRLGILIALDNFGPNATSFAHLKNISFDFISIDRAFIQYLNQDEKTQSIVKAIILLAEGLDIQVSAEGVEHIEQAHILQDLGCSSMQGFLFYKPMPIESFNRIID